MTARRYGLLTAAASSRRSLPPLWTTATSRRSLTWTSGWLTRWASVQSTQVGHDCLGSRAEELPHEVHLLVDR